MNINAAVSLALQRATERVDQAVGVVRGVAPRSSKEPQDHADISAEAVELLAASGSFRAAAALARSAEEIEKHTVDLLRQRGTTPRD